MDVIVVYESVWGNTAAVARAIAEGIGDGARACATDEVVPEAAAEADLIVAGAPVFAFGLPTERIRENIGRTETGADLSHPSLRSWLADLPAGHGRSAAFETRIWWSPRGATGTIEKSLATHGYPLVAKAAKFVVRGKEGPLREGELERAKAWGRELRIAIEPVLG
jgi:flavorubredoxin